MSPGSLGAMGPRPAPAVSALSVAAVVGVVHGAFSIYWGFGGSWLIGTLGENLVEMWREHAVLLLPVGAVKIIAALVPLLLLSHRAMTWLRMLCWAGAVVLILWGGINTVTGNLVLAGVVTPDGGYDREGMIGHAWLWDPLFLVWGVALAVGLRALRGGRS